MYKLLIVEDEEVIREGLKHLIGQISRDFVIAGEASHGQEALRYLEKELPDAVITDIRMREMDGLALTGKIRERYPNMPIVIISGYSEFEYARQALKFGVTDYLLKPIDRLALVAALDEVKSQLAGQRGARVKQPDPTAEAERREEGQAEIRSLIRKVKEYVAARPDGDLRLQVLAEHVHLHPSYLSQLFKAETGYNFSDFVTEVRLERAKHLLRTTGLKVYDIARLSGYQSPKHFMLVFKQQTGLTPGMYREQYGVENGAD
ncbi:response regulator transcription factor [Paenibacillus thalictri]|uniref:Response regulator n=1 Tax=Paenibacillus thalictri TaxID=2527873 RepID=A0A4Q9DV06_9BACL|nr:response regulator [Paenibacillus thalictri]TBL79553.1 response regulator [Paenibacillus thalictri]